MRTFRETDKLIQGHQKRTQKHGNTDKKHREAALNVDQKHTQKPECISRNFSFLSTVGIMTFRKTTDLKRKLYKCKQRAYGQNVFALYFIYLKREGRVIR